MPRAYLPTDHADSVRELIARPEYHALVLGNEDQSDRVRTAAVDDFTQEVLNPSGWGAYKLAVWLLDNKELSVGGRRVTIDWFAPGGLFIMRIGHAYRSGGWSLTTDWWGDCVRRLGQELDRHARRLERRRKQA